MKKSNYRGITPDQVYAHMYKTGEMNPRKAVIACLKRSTMHPIDLTGRRISIHPATRLDLAKALETLGWREDDVSPLASQAISAVCREIINLCGIPLNGRISNKRSTCIISVTLREKTPVERELENLLIYR